MDRSLLVLQAPSFRPSPNLNTPFISPSLRTRFFHSSNLSYPPQLCHLRSPGISEARSSWITLVGSLGILTATLLSAQPSSAAVVNAGLPLVEELLSKEPQNALSLPTWTIHVGSVVEWVTAMALVWQYGGTPGNATWKGLAWGMLPLLGGAMCACTWHFFYNAESLEVLVVLQAALTFIGNFTMWLSAFRIYQSTKGGSKAS